MKANLQLIGPLHIDDRSQTGQCIGNSNQGLIIFQSRKSIPVPYISRTTPTYSILDKTIAS